MEIDVAHPVYRCLHLHHFLYPRIGDKNTGSIRNPGNGRRFKHPMYRGTKSTQIHTPLNPDKARCSQPHHTPPPPFSSSPLNQSVTSSGLSISGA